MSVLVPSQSLSLVSASYTHERALRAAASRLPETKLSSFLFLSAGHAAAGPRYLDTAAHVSSRNTSNNGKYNPALTGASSIARARAMYVSSCAR